MGAVELGARLKEVRDLRSLSLKAVAGPAEISTTYLQKLENGLVQTPSPHVLRRLAGVLRVPYSQLMELAGYVFPKGTKQALTNGRGLLIHALGNEKVTGDEAQALARYLAWYRHDRRTANGEHATGTPRHP